MSQEFTPWFARLQSLPLAVRIAGASALPALFLLLARFYPDALSPVHLQLLLLAGVAIIALFLQLAWGLAAASLGFGVMLWTALHQEGAGTWALAPGAVFDAFLWFALAKLAVVLIAAPQGTVTRLLEAVQRSDREGERQKLLLNEMSHRISNDLSSLVSVLHLQASADPEAADGLNLAAERVLMLGRVHRRLSYGGSPSASVNSRLFLDGLMTDLRASLDGLRPVTLTLSAEEHPLPLTRAGDLGLVVNELVTNALKHAFPGERDGVVRVSFRREDAVYKLTVSDNGVGVGSGPQQPGSGTGLGSRLLRALAAQLGGRLDVMSGDVGGTVATLQFPVPSPQPGEGGVDGGGAIRNAEQPSRKHGAKTLRRARR